MLNKILSLSFLIVFTACSSVRYKPQISGKGVLATRGGLIYSLPPDHPLLRMKLAYREIKDRKLHIRMNFVRKGPYNPASPEILKRKDLTVRIEGQPPDVQPVEIRAPMNKQNDIQLTNARKQSIELIYNLPLAKGETPRFEFFQFHWKISYAKGQSEERLVRFDRQHSRLTSDTEPPDDQDFIDDDAGWFPGGYPLMP